MKIICKKYYNKILFINKNNQKLLGEFKIYVNYTQITQYIKLGYKISNTVVKRKLFTLNNLL